MVLLRFTAVQLFDCRHAPAKLEVQPLVSGAVTRVAVAALAYQLAVGCGPLLLDLFSTPTELGWYGAAFRLTAPLFALAWILATPLVPKLAAAAATQSFGETVERCAELPILLAAIGAGVLYVTAPVVVDLLFGAEFAPAAPVLQLLGIAAAANAMGAFIGTALIAAGRNRHVVGLGLATLAVALCLSILLVPQSGAKGAAEALLAGSVVTAIAAGASTVGAERAALLLLKVLLAGFIAWGAVAILPFGAFGELCAAGLVGAVLSALLVWRSHG
jgi:O-antigen/teichoic acid export membrane protein